MHQTFYLWHHSYFASTWWWWQCALIWTKSGITSYSQQLDSEEAQKGRRMPVASDEHCSHPVSSLLPGMFSKKWCHHCARTGLRLFSYQIYSSCPWAEDPTHLVLLIDWRHSKEENVSWRTSRQDVSVKQHWVVHLQFTSGRQVSRKKRKKIDGIIQNNPNIPASFHII